jgi:hypothetical protein
MPEISYRIVANQYWTTRSTPDVRGKQLKDRSFSVDESVILSTTHEESKRKIWYRRYHLPQEGTGSKSLVFLAQNAAYSVPVFATEIVALSHSLDQSINWLV